MNNSPINSTINSTTVGELADASSLRLFQINSLIANQNCLIRWSGQRHTKSNCLLECPYRFRVTFRAIISYRELTYCDNFHYHEASLSWPTSWSWSSRACPRGWETTWVGYWHFAASLRPHGEQPAVGLLHNEDIFRESNSR